MVTGKLHFWSETGSEGGHWAIQDEKSVHWKPPSFGVWKGSTVKHADGRVGKVEASFKQDGRPTGGDPMYHDPNYVKSSLFRGQGSGDREADAALERMWGFKIKYIEEREGYVQGGTPNIEPEREFGTRSGELTVALVVWEGEEKGEFVRSDDLLTEQWDYEGLHVLKNGDRLKIFDPKGRVEFEGIVDLRQPKLFTESVSGMWMNQGPQDGFFAEDWAKPFLEGWQGELIPA